MAATVYPLAKQSLLKGEIALETSDIKAVAVDTGAYTYATTHQFLSDVAVAARIGTTGNLTGKTTTGGVFDASDALIASFTGTSVETIIVYCDTGSAATSRLLCYLDGFTAFTPDGNDVNLAWNASGIFGI